MNEQLLATRSPSVLGDGGSKEMVDRDSTCADGGSDKMAGVLSGDGDGDITDELIPTGKI